MIMRARPPRVIGDFFGEVAAASDITENAILIRWNGQAQSAVAPSACLLLIDPITLTIRVVNVTA
jgi:hypothetical protein